MADLRRVPLARELFTQWARARGDRVGTSSRPFSRNWEKLLADAGLRSGLEVDEAARDASALVEEGWISITTDRYHRHRINRIAIPLEQEPRWMETIGFVQDSGRDNERRSAREWEQELRFCTSARLAVSFEELVQIDCFLKAGGRTRLLVPIKERSLDIFGDEKRLDELYRGSALFSPDRLSLDALRCFIVPEPLPWARGPNADNPLIVLENVASWDSYRRWYVKTLEFGAVVYGGGDRFREGVLYLAAIFADLGGPRPVYYFGDLDAAGLRIPRLASERATATGLPAIIPHRWSYQRLFDLNPITTPTETEATEVSEPDCQWLGDLAPKAKTLIQSGHRLAQEQVGWEYLSRIST